MATLEDLTLYFYIAAGVGTFCLLALFIMVVVLFYKLHQLARDKSNQLGRQANMMADFCYTNPTIVPGEELSRRGFSMYNGSSTLNRDDVLPQGKEYSAFDEGRSKF